MELFYSQLNKFLFLFYEIENTKLYPGNKIVSQFVCRNVSGRHCKLRQSHLNLFVTIFVDTELIMGRQIINFGAKAVMSARCDRRSRAPWRFIYRLCARDPYVLILVFVCDTQCKRDGVCKFMTRRYLLLSLQSVPYYYTILK